MAQFVGDINRKLVPRWRSSQITLGLGDMKSGGKSRENAFDQFDFDEKVIQWQKTPALSTAAEVVASGFVHARLDDVKEAAQFILNHDLAGRGLLRDLAARALNPFEVEDPDDQQTPGRQIRANRGNLMMEPRDPFRWVDLGRNYLLIGRPAKTARAIGTALQLAPDDRFVLRSAVRFYLHIREPDRALWVLSASDAVPHDPLLVGPEIAVSAILGKSSKLFRRGYMLLEREDSPPSHLCELAAVMATEEFKNGPGRKARQLFRRSLSKPNENTVAQVRWAASNGVGIEFDPSYLYVHRSYEARAWNRFELGEWDRSLSHSKEWMRDQGFSRRPAALGSFIAAVINEDHLDAIAILTKALIANPRDPLLLNNLAYSLASIGEIEKAGHALERITVIEADPNSSVLTVVTLATAGLIEYRKGDIQAGRMLYIKAKQTAESAGLNQQSARLSLFWALEEARAGQAISSPEIDAALAMAQGTQDEVLRVLARRVRELTERPLESR